MKSKKIKILFMATLFILLLELVSAGVSHPAPSNLQLLIGESGRFKFQIQNLGQPDNIICTTTIEEESLLEVEFDDDEMFVESETVKYFFGTVTVPADYSQEILGYDPSGEYTQNFCVQCRMESESAGASVQIRNCGLPINVGVVGERTQANMFVEPKPRAPLGLILGITLIMLAAVIYIVNQRKKQIKAKKSNK